MRWLGILAVLMLLSPSFSAPLLLHPENSSRVGRRVRFLWVPQPADFQRLEIDNTSNFLNPLTFVLPPEENSCEVLLDVGRYWWRVAGVENGREEWSSVWSFTVGEDWEPLDEFRIRVSYSFSPPRPLFPENGSNFRWSPLLRWENTTPVDSFELQLDTSPSFASPVTVMTENSWFEPPPLSDGLYFWRVRGSRNGVYSEFSAVFSFRVDTVPPEIPTLLSPGNGESFLNASPILMWTEPPENSPLTYVVQVSRGGFFSDAVEFLVHENRCVLPPLGQDNYWWRVKARDNAGNESGWTEARRFEVIDTVPPSPPLIVYPSSGENVGSSTPTFRWEPPEENSLPLLFCLQVSRDRYELLFSVWLSVENHACHLPLADGPWYWRVCARDNAGNTGQFSPWIPFTVDTTPPSPPQLFSPSGDVHGTRVRFEWSEGHDNGSGIRGYLLQVSTDPYFERRIEIFSELSFLEYELPGAGEWYWRVGSVDRAGNIGWSEVWAFHCREWRAIERTQAEVGAFARWSELDKGLGEIRALTGEWGTLESFESSPKSVPAWRRLVFVSKGAVGAARWRMVEAAGFVSRAPIPVPLLRFPENGAHVSRVVLSWENLKEADNFEIQIDTPSRFWRPFRFTHQTWYSAGNRAEIPAEKVGEGVKLWRVRAWRSGSSSGWSEVRTFVLDTSVGVPSLRLPENGANLGRRLVYLSWTEVGDNTPPVEYEVQVSTSPGFETPVSSGWIGWSSWSLDLAEGVYFWRVRCRDGLGNIGEFSQPLSFRVDLTPPPTPRNLSPSRGIWLNQREVVLSWSHVADESVPIVYYVLIDNDSDMSTPELAVKTTENSLQVTVPDGSWNWCVIAEDNAGNRSSRVVETFKVDATAPSTPTLTYPAGTVTKPRVRFEWGRSYDPNGVVYDIMIRNVLIEENLENNFYVLRIPLSPGSYAWSVRAKDKLGNATAWSLPVTFEVRDVSPPEIELLEPRAAVGENFVLRLRVRDDFWLKSEECSVRFNGREVGFTIRGEVLESEFRGIAGGKHKLHVLVRDVGGNENRLEVEVTVVSSVRVEPQIIGRGAGEPAILKLHVVNTLPSQVRKRWMVVFPTKVSEVEVELGPSEEKTLEVVLDTSGLREGEYSIKLVDVETGETLEYRLRLTERFPLLLLLSVAFGFLLGVGIGIGRRREVIVEVAAEEEEKFPFEIPPVQRETDEFEIVGGLFKPESVSMKEWERIRKRYSTELSPLMEEYARLLKGSEPVLERYRKIVRGRRED